jgi:hypothetical protein
VTLDATSSIMNYGSKEAREVVEKGTNEIIGGARRKEELCVVFAIERNIEDKNKDGGKWRGFLTGSYIHFWRYWGK